MNLLKSKTDQVFIAGFVILALLYLLPLGKVPVHATEDECRRAIIPMEMCLSGQYLTPTLNGELYLNKPPLYSWLVVIAYKLCGSFSAFALRLPMVLSLLLHGLVIFCITRRYVSERVAALTALAFMTNWRTLTLDSMIGLLEHSLALIMYTGFMLIFILGEKKKYTLLFVLSYLLMAMGFLIKGFPSLVHQGIALSVYFIYSKKFRILFTPAHLLGILSMLLLIALYYVPFLRVNHLQWSEVMQHLFSESSKRYGFDGLRHFIWVIIDFPLDLIKHFLPWTLLILFLIQRNSIPWIRENQFVAYNALLCVTNLPFYWSASLKSPHYLYFLLPLLFVVLIYLWERTPQNAWQKRGFHITVAMAIVFAIGVSLYAPFTDSIFVPNVILKCSILAGILMALFFGLVKLKYNLLFILVGVLMVIRLAFNWFAIPSRAKDQMVYEHYADQIQSIVQNQNLEIIGSYPAGYYDPITYPLEIRRKEILKKAGEPIAENYYLMDEVKVNELHPEVIFHFPFDYADKNLRSKGEMYLVKTR